MRVKEIVILSLLTAILVVQEQVLAFLPNIQLTVLLLVLYTKVVGAKKTAIIICIHVLIDNLVNSSFNIIVIVPMLIGWLLIPLTLGTVAKRVNEPLNLAIISIFLSIAYALCFVIANVFVMEITAVKEYIMADIPFTAMLALSSFLSVLWLYTPLYKVVYKLHFDALNY